MTAHYCCWTSHLQFDIIEFLLQIDVRLIICFHDSFNIIICTTLNLQAVIQRLSERNARKMQQCSSSSTRIAIPILQRPPPLLVPGVTSGLTNYSSLNAMKDFRLFATQPADHRLRNINPNLRATNNIRPLGFATSSTNLIR